MSSLNKKINTYKSISKSSKIINSTNDNINSRNTTDTTNNINKSNNGIDNGGYFYIIQTPDVTNGVYKIGMTCRTNPNKRLCEYPKMSVVKYTIEVADARGFETYIMHKFNLRFKRPREYGLEYYEGSLKKMINIVHKTWMIYGMKKKLYISEKINKLRPIGFQYFCNEWLCDHEKLPSINVMYEAYIQMVTPLIKLSEHVSFRKFRAYLLLLAS